MAEIITAPNPLSIAVGNAVRIKNQADSPDMTVLSIIKPDRQNQGLPWIATVGYFDSRTPQLLSFQTDIASLELIKDDQV